MTVNLEKKPRVTPEISELQSGEFHRAEEIKKALEDLDHADSVTASLLRTSANAYRQKGLNRSELVSTEEAGALILVERPGISVETAKALGEQPLDTLAEALGEIERERGSVELELVIGQIDKVADHSTWDSPERWGQYVKTGEGGLGGETTVQRPEVLQLPENIGERVNKAVEASSFEPTPEVKEAIKGYYEEHYLLGSVIEKVIKNEAGTVDIDSLGSLISNHYLRETAKELLEQGDRFKALKLAEDALCMDLFREDALPLETISETENNYAQKMAQSLRDKAVEDGFAVTFTSELYGDEPVYFWKDGVGNIPLNQSRQLRDPRKINIGNEWDEQQFWKDTRYAGQLEFHNTGQFGKVSREGFVLRSRTRQRQLKGSFYSQMGTVHTSSGGNMHSNLPHFTETYSDFEYKSQAEGLGNVIEKDPPTPASAAIPLAEIVDIAPYARDAKYGVLKLKEGSNTRVIPIKDKIGSIGSQGFDNHGEHGEDRVFMADYRADNVEGAVNYDIPFGDVGKVVMTESEKRSQTFGHGKGYAEEVVIPDIKVGDYSKIKQAHPEMSDREFTDFYADIIEQNRRSQAEAIQKLQAESINKHKYANKVVAPLRRGVLEFMPEAKGFGGQIDRTHRFKKVSAYAQAL
jgi:hypothetical protein